MSPSTETSHLALLARIGARTCALPLSQVAEVSRPLPIEPLPTPVEAVLGITTLRGESVPVVDLARLLGERGSPTRFVVVRVAQRTAVLAVDEVVGVRDLAEGALASLPPLLEDHAETLSRIGRLDGDLLLVLRAARFVSDDLRPSQPNGGNR